MLEALEAGGDGGVAVGPAVEPVEAGEDRRAPRAPAGGRGAGGSRRRSRPAPSPSSGRGAGGGRRCRSVPPSGVMAPRSISSVVVLPAPFGPSSATRSPARDGEVDAVDGAARRGTSSTRPRASSTVPLGHGRRAYGRQAPDAPVEFPAIGRCYRLGDPQIAPHRRARRRGRAGSRAIEPVITPSREALSPSTPCFRRDEGRTSWNRRSTARSWSRRTAPSSPAIVEAMGGKADVPGQEGRPRRPDPRSSPACPAPTAPPRRAGDAGQRRPTGRHRPVAARARRRAGCADGERRPISRPPRREPSRARRLPELEAAAPQERRRAGPRPAAGPAPGGPAATTTASPATAAAGAAVATATATAGPGGQGQGGRQGQQGGQGQQATRAATSGPAGGRSTASPSTSRACSTCATRATASCASTATCRRRTTCTSR